MIKGYKPSGYFVTIDKNGNKVEGETRQCVHCQFTWEYIPGSGRERGFCLNCRGLLCGAKACMQHCAPFSEIAQQGYKEYELTDGGVFVKK